VLATGSFDASVGIWRHEGPGSGAGEARDGGGDGDGDADGDEDWHFAVVLDGHESEVKSVAWSAGATYLATCSRDKSVWIWEEVGGVGDDEFETVAVLQEHEADVKCVVWHPEDECLASCGYDDTIRLYREDVDDWTAVAVLRGHENTVWAIDWEGINGGSGRDRVESGEMEVRPRIVSCSGDGSVKVWRRVGGGSGFNLAEERNRVTSILRTTSIEEHWEVQETLPQLHASAVLSVCWSKMSGRIVSTGTDGRIVIYEEKAKGANAAAEAKEWTVLAELEAAHGVYEINHVCWARRWDRGSTEDVEEVVLSTGDDGVVKVWTLDV
jgi:WD40 repeat protein